jgi:hypothetical protein
MANPRAPAAAASDAQLMHRQFTGHSQRVHRPHTGKGTGNARRADSEQIRYGHTKIHSKRGDCEFVRNKSNQMNRVAC